jgi:hypothetical protein
MQTHSIQLMDLVQLDAVRQIKRRIKSAEFADAMTEMRLYSLTELDYRRIIDCSYKKANRMSADLLRYVFYESAYRYMLDPTADQNKLYRLACKYGNSDIVSMLLQDKRFDPMYMDSYPLELAVSYGALNIISLLIQDKRVDPKGVLHTVCGSSCQNKLDVVKLMVRDSRLSSDVTDLHNVIVAARIHKQKDIEELIIAVLCGAE